MSGFFRNFFTVLAALWRQKQAPGSTVSSWFFITPLDTGLATLKSDKYLQLAESAQMDYLIRTGLVRKLLTSGYRFVNAAQLVKFSKPVRLFSRVRVETAVAYADTKCAYFVHRFHVGPDKHAEVLVKMKFKKGPVTVPADALLGSCSGEKPAWALRWDDTLAAL